MIKTLIHLPSLILFLFIYWKRLKEDYSASLIFNSAFLMATTVIAGVLVALQFFSDWWFWFGLAGVLIGFTASFYKHKLAFYESLEALIVGLLPWLGIVFLFAFLSNRDVATGIGSLIIFLLLFAYLLLDMHYKTFSWYKSGRVGFSGLTILGTFFLIRATIALFFPDVLSFTGMFDAIVSGLISFVAFIAVFNLSRKIS